MHTVGAFEAKTHLSALLDRVAARETIIITRHGSPAAVLAPVPAEPPKRTHQELAAALRDIRSRTKPGTMSIRDMIRAGRRY